MTQADILIKNGSSLPSMSLWPSSLRVCGDFRGQDSRSGRGRADVGPVLSMPGTVWSCLAWLIRI